MSNSKRYKNLSKVFDRMPEEHHNIRDFRNTFTKEICLSEDLSPHQPSRIFSDLFCYFLYRNL